MRPKALYIHIPFCVRKCRYCDFNSIVSESKIIDSYLNAIDKEMSIVYDGYGFETIYIGGGTPTVLSETQLEKLLYSVARNFPMQDVCEYTIEANPGTLTVNKIRLLQEYGLNRISLGVQSFQDRQLDFLGRVHSSNDAINAFALLRKGNFKNINIDLIFGCPGQTLDDWKEELKIVSDLNPEHISTYALTYEDGTPLTKDMMDKSICKTDERVELEMYKATIGYLTQNGYTHYEISNFARDGHECSHNHVYWRNVSYRGVGAGAYSYIEGFRTSNEKDVSAYIGKLQAGGDTKYFTEYLEPDQCASETVIMFLRLRQGITNGDFYARFGYKLEDQFGDKIRKLLKNGFISYDDERLKLTEKGLFVADTILTEFV
jgi:oxygen-independent coproporphyrinogen-3 oxidase